MDMSALKEALKSTLLEYRKKRPELSLRAIARRSGVNRYFLTKILEDKQSGDQVLLDLNQVLLLSKFLTKKDSIPEIISSSPGAVKEALSPLMDVNAEDRVLKVSSEDLDLYDQALFLVFHMLAFGNGVLKDQISRVLGESGLLALATLDDLGMVQEKDGRLCLNKDSSFTYSAELSKHHIPNFLRFYKPKYSGSNEKRNLIFSATQGLNSQGLGKVHAVLSDAYKQVESIMDNDKNWGDIPVFALSCFDSFIDDISERG